MPPSSSPEYIDVDAIDIEAIDVDAIQDVDPSHLDAIRVSFQTNFVDDAENGLDLFVTQFISNCSAFNTAISRSIDKSDGAIIISTADAGLQALWDRITANPTSFRGQPLHKSINALGNVMIRLHHIQHVICPVTDEIISDDSRIEEARTKRYSLFTLFFNYRKLRAWSISPGSSRWLPIHIHPADKINQTSFTKSVRSASPNDQLAVFDELDENPTKGSVIHGLFGYNLTTWFPKSPSISKDIPPIGITSNTMEVKQALIESKQVEDFTSNQVDHVNSRKRKSPSVEIQKVSRSRSTSIENHRHVESPSTSKISIDLTSSSPKTATLPQIVSVPTSSVEKVISPNRRRPPFPPDVPYYRCNHCGATIPRKRTFRDRSDLEYRTLLCSACFQYVNTNGKHRPRHVLDQFKFKNPHLQFDDMSLFSILPPDASETNNSKSATTVEDHSTVVDADGDVTMSSTPSHFPSTTTKHQIKRLKGPNLTKYKDGSDIPILEKFTFDLSVEDLKRRLVLRCFDRKDGKDEDEEWQIRAPTKWPTNYHLAVQACVNKGKGFKLSPALPPDLDFHTRDMSIEEIPINDRLQAGSNVVEFLFKRQCDNKMFVLEAWPLESEKW